MDIVVYRIEFGQEPRLGVRSGSHLCLDRPIS
jgi:hypothetical protein